MINSKEFWRQTIFFAVLFYAIIWLSGKLQAAPVYPPRGAVIHHPHGDRIYNPPRRYTRQQQQHYLYMKQLLKRQKPTVINHNTTVVNKYYNPVQESRTASGRVTRTHKVYVPMGRNPYLDGVPVNNPYYKGGTDGYIINPYCVEKK